MGHDAIFFERDVPMTRRRAIFTAATATSVLDREWSETSPLAELALADADVALVTSCCPDALQIVGRPRRVARNTCMRRALLLLAFTFVVASRAEAAWWPVFSPATYVQLRPGESVTLRAQASWLSGISVVPFLPMTFAAEDASVATVDGYLPTTSPAVPVRITALRPGVTRLRIVESGLTFSTLPLVVVAEEELPLAIEVNGVLAPGRPVTLKAVSDEPDATFTWYWGTFGGTYTYFWKMGEGREIVVTENAPLQYSYWVLMTSPRGAGATSVSIQLSEPASKRRAARH